MLTDNFGSIYLTRTLSFVKLLTELPTAAKICLTASEYISGRDLEPVSMLDVCCSNPATMDIMYWLSDVSVSDSETPPSKSALSSSEEPSAAVSKNRSSSEHGCGEGDRLMQHGLQLVTAVYQYYIHEALKTDLYEQRMYLETQVRLQTAEVMEVSILDWRHGYQYQYQSAEELQPKSMAY